MNSNTTSQALKHTPEPWRIDGWDLWHEGVDYGDESDPHLFTGLSAEGMANPLARRNLERARDCVNAMQSIQDPAALRRETIEVLRELIRQCSIERMMRAQAHGFTGTLDELNEQADEPLYLLEARKCLSAWTAGQSGATGKE